MILKNGLLSGQSCDILIEDGRIVQIGADLDALGQEVYDCRGLTFLPGLIDLHCHLREPGQEYKEDIASGTRAAVRGGFTGVCCMPNTKPVNDNAAVTRFMLEQARTAGLARVYPIGAVTRGMQSGELAEFAELKDAGCVALSDDGKPVLTPGMMRMAMRYSLAFDLPIADHCEEMTLAADGVMNEGETSSRIGLPGIPASAEEAMVARDCILALETGARLHLCHMSTRGSIELIRHFKKQGGRITCETAPHYIAGTDALCEGYDTHAKVNPPLRTEDDRLAIIEGLLDGTIDCIATDHAPHHRDEKEVEFSLAANGISGFETALALCHTYLVEAGHMSQDRLMDLMSTNPARIFGLPGGAIALGEIADIVLFDPGERWTIDREQFVSRGKNSPFHGFAVTGRVKATFVGGKCVFEEASV